MSEFRKNNHYVPQMYLKRWSQDKKHIFGYRLLVSHADFPQWGKYSVDRFASQEYLYSQVGEDGETDEFERLLSEEFESPAEEALSKATSDQQLSPKDYINLIRFAAVQYARTPARVVEFIKRWEKDIPTLLSEAMEESARRIKSGNVKPIADFPLDESVLSYSPFSVKMTHGLDSGTHRFTGTALTGRRMWLFSMKVILTKTVKELFKHRWCIYKVPTDMNWITSDDPVLCLNYYGKGKYDFKGGWGSIGSEIILPISPKHLLYTQVGTRNPNKYLTTEQSLITQDLIAKHAHRWIYAEKPIKEIEKLRPRIIDEFGFKAEEDAWKRWHEDQGNAERLIF